MFGDDNVFYIIIWTKYRRLAVAEAQEFDLIDYKLTSEVRYKDEDEAYTRAIELGKENGVEVDIEDWHPVLEKN